MDPSLSVTNDPHHPPQFTTYPPFTNSNPFAAPAPPNHPFFSTAPPNNNHMFQPPPTPIPPAPTHPSIAHPPYSDMICSAIATLNEPDGSSKQAISRYIERSYTGIPPAHGALLTHHLKTLKNSGILMMVRKSYKFAVTPPPTTVAVAASAGLELPRSDFTVNENQPLSYPAVAPALTPPTQTQKRGRGRPPKAKPDVQPQTNGIPNWEQTELPMEVQQQLHPELQPQQHIQSQVPVKRPPGRPRKDGALPTIKASVSGGVETVKRRGRPPSGRAAGRERKPTIVSAPVSVFPYVANGGVRRRGRPKRVDAGASSVVPPQPVNAESGGEVVAQKRGRGRPPKIGGVIRKTMKPRRGIIPRTGRPVGRPVGRPRKNTVSTRAFGQQDGDYGELKRKFELFQAKAKDIVIVLKGEIGRSGNQAVLQAINDLEGLTETTNEPQHMEELQPEEEDAEPEAEGQGQGQAQTEAEAMQEALF